MRREQRIFIAVRKPQLPDPPRGYGEGWAAVRRYISCSALAAAAVGTRPDPPATKKVKLRRDSQNCGTLAAARDRIGLSTLARLHHCGSLRPMSAILAKLANQEAGLSCLYVLSRG